VEIIKKYEKYLTYWVSEKDNGQKDYASAYDFLYQDKDYEKECDFIESIFVRYSGNVKRVLDLGCGTGGHALILVRRGYHIVGVDR